MGRHDTVVVRGEPEKAYGLAGHETVARPVEAVAADAVLLEPLERHRVGVGDRRHRLVEGGVEDPDLQEPREEVLRDPDADEVRRVVERPEGDALLDLRDDFRRDRHGARELRAAVDDAVPHREEAVCEAEPAKHVDDGVQRLVVESAGDRPRRLRAVPLDVEGGLGRAEPLGDARDVLDRDVGVDDRELEGRGSAVEDEYVHALLPVPDGTGR